PAIDAGANPDGLAFDQRGTGFPRVLGSQVDIGAVEGIDVTPAATLMSATNVSTSGLLTASFIVKYTDDFGIDTTSIDTNDLLITGRSFQIPVKPSSFHIDAVSVSGDAVTVTYTLAAPNPVAGWQPMDNDTYSITLVANEIADLDVPTHSM